jgi:hypothetical protein
MRDACDETFVSIAQNLANDCERMTAEFGCANGCFPHPVGYPGAADATPFWTVHPGDMLPHACVMQPLLELGRPDSGGDSWPDAEF